MQVNANRALYAVAGRGDGTTHCGTPCVHGFHFRQAANPMPLQSL